ncbi:MAG TPA: hypothetical protein PK674_00785 [Candidatus Absconditabacterales bacterium]|nr:hypothetical protein [Candidatus Absconditabacterales bacterium]HOQ79231.1 hypothetical protein [Candidatus Absconditabacterales bacterium]HPK27759.1 hypothetical protein [Candidatus Absconditabacterales bacterium]
MVTIIISVILIWALYSVLFRSTNFVTLFASGLLIGALVGFVVALLIPPKFEEKVSSFPLEKVQYKTDTGKYTFLEMETIEDEEYYIFYYYGDNGILEQDKFLTKNVSIKPGCDTAKVEFKKFSRDEDATINYFSIGRPADTEVTIYLPSCPVEGIKSKLSLN